MGIARLVSDGLLLLERIGQVPEPLVMPVLIVMSGLPCVEKSFLSKTGVAITFHCSGE